MRLFYYLLAIAFTLPLLAASDDIRRRGETRENVQSGGLKGSSARNEPTSELYTRHLTWSHWWWSKGKNKNRRKPTYVATTTTTASCNCKDPWEEFEFSAFMGNAIASASNVNEIGGRYVYNSPLSQNAALSEPFEGSTAFMTGDCTRFQNLEILADGNRILGAGLCTFILSVDTSNVKGSIIMQGELFDIIPSTFSITGGTEDFDGARGNALFSPFYDDGGTDVFTEASHVELDVDAERVLDIIL